MLPVADIGWTCKLNQTQAESVGWQQLVGSVRHVGRHYHQVGQPAVIFTAD